MKKYCVQIAQVHQQNVYVYADSSERALELVSHGYGADKELHYDYSLEPDNWKVFEVK